MTQGIFINTAEGVPFMSRPKSKKQIKELVKDGQAHTIHLEATSMFGNEYGGSLDFAPNGTYTFVGPDPYTNRKFYGNIVIRDGKIKVT